MITLSSMPTRTTIHVQAVRMRDTGVRLVRAIPTTLHSTTRTDFKTGQVLILTESSRPR